MTSRTASRDFAHAVKRRGRTAWAKAHERLCKLRRIDVGLARLRHSKGVEIGNSRFRLDAPFAHPAGDSSRSKSALAHATDGRVACVIRSLSRRLRCYQLQYEAQFFMRAIPPLLACKGFVRG